MRKPARQHLRGDFVIQLEAAGLERSSVSSSRGNSFSAVTVSVDSAPVNDQRDETQAAAAEVRGQRLVRVPARRACSGCRRRCRRARRAAPRSIGT